jgi:hypothetical protein
MIMSRNMAGAAGFTEPSRKKKDKAKASPLQSGITSSDSDFERVRARGSAK